MRVLHGRALALHPKADDLCVGGASATEPNFWGLASRPGTCAAPFLRKRLVINEAATTTSRPASVPAAKAMAQGTQRGAGAATGAGAGGPKRLSSLLIILLAWHERCAA
jgi:hypothetical protein